MKSTYHRIGAAVILSVTGVVGLLGLPFLAQAATFNRQLELGMSGDDVSALQQFLATDPSVYPQGLVTGYFGTLTSAAVSLYQSKNGIDSVGRVGPATLALLNSSSNGIGGSDDVRAPILQVESVMAGRTSATISWYTNEPAFARVMYGTQWPFLLETAASVSGAGGLSTYQTVTINNLSPSSTYYYVIQSTDQSGNVNQTVGKAFMTTSS